jgi:WD40 repeat protein
MGSPIVAAAAEGGEVALADRRGDLELLGPNGAGPAFEAHDVSALAFAGPGRLFTGSKDGVDGWRTAGGVLEPTALHVTTPGPVLGISAGGGRFLVRLAQQVRIYDDDGTLVSTIRTAAEHATLSPGGLGVATTKGKVAQLWDASTGKLLHTLRGHSSLVTDAEYSPSGQDLVTVSDDHDGRIWSVASGRLIHLLRGHFFPVRTGSYSPDGRWIVTASQFTAGLWNAGTGQFLFYVGRHAAPLTGASFSRSGNWILTGSADKTARVYHCLICQPLPGLEATAAARLHALRR